MGVEISTFPTLPASLQTVTLEGAQYQLRLTWRHRCQAWYLDLFTLAGVPLVLGRRLSPGWSPTMGLVIEDGPGGYLYVRGRDSYAREDLGATLRLLYYTAAEVAAVAEASDAGVAVDLV